MVNFNYPATKRDESVSDTFKKADGSEQVVKDPYRWLEDQNSEETAKWVKEQNKVTKEYIGSGEDKISEQLEKELLEKINYPKTSFYRRRGNRLFFDRNPGLLNQSIIYMCDADKPEKEVVLLDPNQFSPDGTWSLNSFTISDSGRTIIYGFCKSGSDWVTLKVLRVPEKLEDPIVTLDETIEWVKFSSASFDKEELGFIYSRYPEDKSLANIDKGTETDANHNHSAYYHRIGTDQSQDVLVYADDANPEYIIGSSFTNDYRYLLISVFKDCNPEHKLIVITNFDEAIKEKKPFNEIKLFNEFTASYSYIHNDGNRFWFHTNLDAPLNKVISLPLPTKEGDALAIKEVIPERDHLNQYAGYTQGKIYTSFLKDVQESIQVFDMEGKFLKQLELPDIGAISGFSPNPDHEHIYFIFNSFIYPDTILYVNAKDDKVVVFKEPQIPNYDPKEYTCKQIFYNSKDGTKVPMFIVHKKTFVPKGDAPTFLTAYGGFDISYSPYFSPSYIFFVDKFDGIFALANIRGGGEYGKKWHKGGSLLNKTNCFEDFAAASRYLVENNYTRPSKITINGGSNGGLLVGASLNRNPELFGCCIADVGVMDMLRFHKFTIGSHWCSDYGCSEDPTYFEYIYGYSPLHNVSADPNIVYPATLLTTGDHDDRVIPAHSYKLISQLQHIRGNLPSQVNPLLISIDEKAGHGAGKPLTKKVKEFVTKLNFISKSTNSKPKL